MLQSQLAMSQCSNSRRNVLLLPKPDLAHNNQYARKAQPVDIHRRQSIQGALHTTAFSPPLSHRLALVICHRSPGEAQPVDIHRSQSTLGATPSKSRRQVEERNRDTKPLERPSNEKNSKHNQRRETAARHLAVTTAYSQTRQLISK